MERYWLFGGEKCYPSGGFEDYLDSNNSITDLERYAKTWLEGQGEYSSRDWIEILDTETMKLVFKLGNKRGDWK